MLFVTVHTKDTSWNFEILFSLLIVGNGKTYHCWLCVKPSAKHLQIRELSFHTIYVGPAYAICDWLERLVGRQAWGLFGDPT